MPYISDKTVVFYRYKAVKSAVNENTTPDLSEAPFADEFYKAVFKDENFNVHDTLTLMNNIQNFKNKYKIDFAVNGKSITFNGKSWNPNSDSIILPNEWRSYQLISSNGVSNRGVLHKSMSGIKSDIHINILLKNGKNRYIDKFSKATHDINKLMVNGQYQEIYEIFFNTAEKYQKILDNHTTVEYHNPNMQRIWHILELSNTLVDNKIYKFYENKLKNTINNVSNVRITDVMGSGRSANKVDLHKVAFSDDYLLKFDKAIYENSYSMSTMRNIYDKLDVVKRRLKKNKVLSTVINVDHIYFTLNEHLTKELLISFFQDVIVLLKLYNSVRVIEYFMTKTQIDINNKKFVKDFHLRGLKSHLHMTSQMRVLISKVENIINRISNMAIVDGKLYEIELKSSMSKMAKNNNVELVWNSAVSGSADNDTMVMDGNVKYEMKPTKLFVDDGYLTFNPITVSVGNVSHTFEYHSGSGYFKNRNFGGNNITINGTVIDVINSPLNTKSMAFFNFVIDNGISVESGLDLFYKYAFMFCNDDEMMRKMLKIYLKSEKKTEAPLDDQSQVSIGISNMVNMLDIVPVNYYFSKTPYLNIMQSFKNRIKNYQLQNIKHFRPALTNNEYSDFLSKYDKVQNSDDIFSSMARHITGSSSEQKLYHHLNTEYPYLNIENADSTALTEDEKNDLIHSKKNLSTIFENIRAKLEPTYKADIDYVINNELSHASAYFEYLKGEMLDTHFGKIVNGTNGHYILKTNDDDIMEIYRLYIKNACEFIDLLVNSIAVIYPKHTSLEWLCRYKAQFDNVYTLIKTGSLKLQGSGKRKAKLKQKEITINFSFN